MGMELVTTVGRVTSRRWRQLTISAILGLALWFGLVVIREDTGGSAFLWALLLSAVALGLRTNTDSEAWQVGAGLAGAPLLVALWTVPHGDDDGLWLLWLPFLAGLVLVPTAIALVARASLRRLRRRSSRS